MNKIAIHNTLRKTCIPKEMHSNSIFSSNDKQKVFNLHIMVSTYVIFVSNMQLYSLKLIKNNNNNKIINIGLLIIIMD